MFPIFQDKEISFLAYISLLLSILLSMIAFIIPVRLNENIVLLIAIFVNTVVTFL